MLRTTLLSSAGQRGLWRSATSSCEGGMAAGVKDPTTTTTTTTTYSGLGPKGAPASPPTIPASRRRMSSGLHNLAMPCDRDEGGARLQPRLKTATPPGSPGPAAHRKVYRSCSTLFADAAPVLLSVLGKGSYGTVYKARWRNSDVSRTTWV